MLGETLNELYVDRRGADGDRRWALLDRSTGHVPSAKQARLWRGLLQCSARFDDGRVLIQMLDGTSVAGNARQVDDLLSQFLGRAVRLLDERPFPGPPMRLSTPREM